MNQDDIARSAEVLAMHLHEIRLSGRPCPTNIIATAQGRLKCSRGIATMVKDHLVESGRLYVYPAKGIFRIDGSDFSKTIEGFDPLDALKEVLRRRYHPVFDPRTRTHELKIPSADGQPTHLIVGTQLLTIEQARDVAGTVLRRAR